MTLLNNVITIKRNTLRVKRISMRTKKSFENIINSLFASGDKTLKEEICISSHSFQEYGNE